MKNNPKRGDIGIYSFNGLTMEVKLAEEFNNDQTNLLVCNARGEYFKAYSKDIQWDKEIKVVDKPIVLDPNIEWHNNLDQDSLRLGYRPLIKGEEKEIGDQYFDKIWTEITSRGTAYANTQYRTKRPLSDVLEKKKAKLTAKIEDLKTELKLARMELAKVSL